jgi:aryl-alcohol dehydrogenase-like predicted oxidoreductase
MQEVPLGATGLRVSRIGFGSATYAYEGIERHTVERLLNVVLDAGVNVIDTAACYPGAEPIIGSGIANRRDEYVLVSKCGHRVAGLSGEPFSGELVAATVDRALEQLRTDRLDVMLLHSCSLEELERGDALAALVRAQEQGKVRCIGYSGDNETLVAAVAKPEVQVIETSVNLADQANIDRGVAAAARRGIAVIAKRPIANGAWREPKAIGALAEYAAGYRPRLQAMALDPADYELSTSASRGLDPWVQLALRFTLSVPGLHTAVIGTRDASHLAGNVEIADAGGLSAADYQRLREAFISGEQTSDGRWDGLT